MEPTTLQQLIEAGCVTGLRCGITIQTQPEWVVTGETRLSYTTLTRLVECCREYHWQTDILNLSSVPLDSTCKSLNAEFLQPVPVTTRIAIQYKVKQVRKKGYELRFEIRSIDQQTLYAIFNMVSVFYNPETNRAIIPPESVFGKLTELSRQVTN